MSPISSLPFHVLFLILSLIYGILSHVLYMASFSLGPYGSCPMPCVLYLRSFCLMSYVWCFLLQVPLSHFLYPVSFSLGPFVLCPVLGVFYCWSLCPKLCLVSFTPGPFVSCPMPNLFYSRSLFLMSYAWFLILEVPLSHVLCLVCFTPDPFASFPMPCVF